jgi:hypothetical protein
MGFLFSGICYNVSLRFICLPLANEYREVIVEKVLDFARTDNFGSMNKIYFTNFNKLELKISDGATIGSSKGI